ncbi:MAG: stalled ribosome rescue protein Dom34 [Chitinophagales bacterium]|jgi:stalled ribosome rescue protein Dom34
MENNKNLGIWMDHSYAQVIDLNSKNNSCSITSEFTFKTKEEALSRSENLMHNKRQQMLEVYYKEIAEKILNYNKVLLFGPTNAKVELHNYLNKDSHFKDINFSIKTADKLTGNEKDAFVKNHFENK